jgi:uncharacterized protein
MPGGATIDDDELRRMTVTVSAVARSRAGARRKVARNRARIDPAFARFRLAVRRSPIERFGVFAEVRIPAGHAVIEYTGKRILQSDAPRYAHRRRCYLARLNARWAIDGAIGGCGAELVNHSCAPNLKVRRRRGHLLFVARRAIAAGEEITIDYRFSPDIDLVACKCGAPTCRGTINRRR